MDVLDEEVDEVVGSATSASTRGVYISGIVRFVAWLWRYPESRCCLTEAFTTEASASGYSDALARSWLHQKPFVSPVCLDALSHQVFCRFLVQQKRADGELYSKSVMESFRSSLVYLYTLSGRRLDPKFASRLTLFYKGYKRKITKYRQDTNARIYEGKEPFSFALYRKIGCFPTAPSNFRKVCEFCIASVAKHAKYLLSTLPGNHLLLQTPLFRDLTLLETVTRIVECRNYQPADPIRPTGIPPHIGILVQLAEFKQAVGSIVPAMRTELREVLHEQQQQSVLGAAEVEQVLTQVLTKHGVIVSAPNCARQAPTNAKEPPIYTWGGGLHRVPQDFTFPPVPLATAWQLWRIGDSTRGHPPYHLLTTKDVGPKKAKRLRELQNLMHTIEHCLDSRGIRYREIDAVQAAAAFASIEPSLPLPRLSSTGRQRRLHQLSWMTLARSLRKCEN